MKNSILSYVGWLLLAVALGFYVYGIYTAIYLSWPPIPEIPNPDAKPLPFNEVLSTTIGSLQALLLANLGMLLGISIARPNSAVAHALKLNRAAITEDPKDPDVKEKIQLFALVLYVVCLVACFITWIRNDFISDPKEVVSVIPESGKLFIGVVLAYLTAVLK